MTREAAAPSDPHLQNKQFRVSADSMAQVWRSGDWVILFTKSAGVETTISFTPERALELGAHLTALAGAVKE